MGYGNRVKQALLNVDQRYADSIARYQVNASNPDWIRSNIPGEAALSLHEILDTIQASGLSNRGEYIDAATTTLGAVGSRYLAPMTAVGLSLAGLTRALAGPEEQY